MGLVKSLPYKEIAPEYVPPSKCPRCGSAIGRMPWTGWRACTKCDWEE